MRYQQQNNINVANLIVSLAYNENNPPHTPSTWHSKCNLYQPKNNCIAIRSKYTSDHTKSPTNTRDFIHFSSPIANQFLFTSITIDHHPPFSSNLLQMNINISTKKQTNKKTTLKQTNIHA